MNPFGDFNLDDLIRILFFVVIVGGAIVQAIYRAFIAPLKRAGKRVERRPPPQLQEFLDEIRRQRTPVEDDDGAPAQQPRPGSVEAETEAEADPRPEDPLAPRAEPPWKRAPQERPRPVRPRPGHQANVERGPIPEHAGAERAGRVGAPDANTADRSLAQELEHKEISRVSQRHIRSALAERHLDAKVSEQSLEGTLGDRLTAKYGSARRPERAPRMAHLPGLPAGVGLREGILLQAILGPPLAYQRRGRPGRGAGPGSPA